MARRRQSKEEVYCEAAFGIAGMIVLMCLISAQFRALVLLIVVGGIGILLLSLVIWAVCRSLKPRPSLSSFGTMDQDYRLQDPPSFQPPTIGGQMPIIQSVREPSLVEQLRKMDWFQFEKLIELIYQHRGFSVKRLGGANPDGGVDLIVESSTEEFVVQCKHWRKWTVGVRHIREFLGTLTDTKIQKGIFVTLSGYSGEAKQLADKHGIQILNQSDIIGMLEESGLRYTQEISELLSDQRKFCPKCEKEMVLRTARVKGNQFWGCSNYPRCRFVLNLEG